jgi:hypothetical protein
LLIENQEKISRTKKISNFKGKELIKSMRLKTTTGKISNNKSQEPKKYQISK